MDLDKDFNAKQEELLAVLEAAEKKYKKNTVVKIAEGKMSRDEIMLQKRIFKSYKREESIFKVPEVPERILQKQFIPDYKLNPHKWKRYSLDDVSPDHLSERGNSAAALQFLDEMEARKKTEGVTSNEIHSTDPDNAEEPHFSGSKLIMPEYRVGGKINKKLKRPLVTPENSVQVKLQHLADEFD